MAKCDPYYRDPRSRQDALTFPSKSEQGYYHRSKIRDLNEQMYEQRNILTELLAEGQPFVASSLTVGTSNDNATGLMTGITISDGTGGYLSWSNRDEFLELVKSVMKAKV